MKYGEGMLLSGQTELDLPSESCHLELCLTAQEQQGMFNQKSLLCTSLFSWHIQNILRKYLVLKIPDLFCCLCSVLQFSFLCIQITDIKVVLNTAGVTPWLKVGLHPIWKNKGKTKLYWNQLVGPPSDLKKLKFGSLSMCFVTALWFQHAGLKSFSPFSVQTEPSVFLLMLCTFY